MKALGVSIKNTMKFYRDRRSDGPPTIKDERPYKYTNRWKSKLAVPASGHNGITNLRRLTDLD
jgi:hypothetical protein